jgi:cell division protein FtsB
MGSVIYFLAKSKETDKIKKLKQENKDLVEEIEEIDDAIAINNNISFNSVDELLDSLNE